MGFLFREAACVPNVVPEVLSCWLSSFLATSCSDTQRYAVLRVIGEASASSMTDLCDFFCCAGEMCQDACVRARVCRSRTCVW